MTRVERHVGGRCRSPTPGADCTERKFRVSYESYAPCDAAFNAAVVDARFRGAGYARRAANLNRRAHGSHQASTLQQLPWGVQGSLVPCLVVKALPGTKTAGHVCCSAVIMAHGMTVRTIMAP